MLSNKEKKSRKSKLVPREQYSDDLDYVQSDVCVKGENEVEQQNEDPETTEPVSTVKLEIDIDKENPPASVKVEVEEVAEADDDVFCIYDEPEIIDVDLCPSSPEATKIDDDPDENIDTIEISDDEVKITEKNHIFITDADILQELEELSRLTLSVCDTALDIEVRNFIGRFTLKQEPVHPVDRHISEAVHNWENWLTLLKTKKKIRVNEAFDQPLLYKCLFCNIAWFHMYPFRQHIKRHYGPNIKIALELSHSECNMFCASRIGLFEGKHLKVKGTCWKCGENYNFHRKQDNKLHKHIHNKYQCGVCLKFFNTCYEIKCHQHMCLSLQKCSYGCPFCSRRFAAEEQLNEHLSVTHLVRSDLPLYSYRLNACTLCDAPYVRYNQHSCSKRVGSKKCSHCHRTYSSMFIYSIHLSFNKGVKCRECGKSLLRQCSEPTHLITHSKNFTMVQRCIICYASFSTTKDAYEHMNDHDHSMSKKIEMVIVPMRCWDPNAQRHTVVPEERIEITEGSDDPHNSSYDETRAAVLNILGTADSDMQEYIDHFGVDVKTEKMDEDVVIPSDVSTDLDTAKTVTILNIKDEVSDVDSSMFVDDGVLVDENGIIQENTCNGIDTEMPEHDTTQEEIHTHNTKEIAVKMERVDEENVERTEIDIFEHEIIDHVEKEEIVKKETIDIAVNSIKVEPLNETPVHISVSKIKEEPIDEVAIKDNIGNTHTYNVNIKLTKSDKNQKDFFNNIIIKEENIDVANLLDSESTTQPRNDSESIAQPISDIDSTAQPTDSENKAHPRCSDMVMLTSHGKAYRCKNCHKWMALRQLKSHMCKIVGRKTYKCSKCSQSYLNINLYCAHFEIAHEEMNCNECPQCRKHFSPAHLVCHVRTHVRTLFSMVNVLNADGVVEKLYKCNRCKTKLNFRGRFEHWESHLWSVRVKEENSGDSAEDMENRAVGEPLEYIDEDNPVLNEEQKSIAIKFIQSKRTKYTRVITPLKKCPLCLRTFDRYNEAKRHVAEHLVKDAYANKWKYQALVCQACSERCDDASSFRLHLRNHGSLTSYMCKICNKTFSDSSNFCKHKKVHGTNVFKCDLCGTKFQKKKNLEIHMEIHLAQPNPFKCDLCPQQFYLEVKLRKHKYLVHNKEYMFRCHICRKGFSSIRERADHLWEVHKERNFKADCPVCDLAFRKFLDVKRHLSEVHHVKMNITKKNFSQDVFSHVVRTCHEEAREMLVVLHDEP